MKSTGHQGKVICGLLGCGLLAATATGAVATPAAASDEPWAEMAVDAYSQYIWRGYAFSRDSIVIQPSMAVGWRGFSAELWGNLDTDSYDADTSQGGVRVEGLYRWQIYPGACQE